MDPEPLPASQPLPTSVPSITVTHTLSLSAIHSLRSPSLTPLAATKSYGLASSPHPHAYTFHISIRGALNTSTGQLCLAELVEDAVGMALFDVLHNKNLDEVSWFLKRPSTLPNLALFAWRNLGVILRVHPVSLVEVRIECEGGCEKVPVGTNGSLASRGIKQTSVSYKGETTTLEGLR